MDEQPRSKIAPPLTRRAFVAVGAAALASATAPPRTGAAGPAATEKAAPNKAATGRKLVTLEVHDDRRVTFRLDFPAARKVMLGGDYPLGSIHFLKEDRTVIETALTRDSTNVWSVTVGPLRPGFYNYYFAVDGARILDAKNPFVVRSSINHFNLLHVPGPDSMPYAINDVPHGTLSKIWYSSPALGTARLACVYTPPGYEGGDVDYPVAYLLHGGSGDEDSWATLGRTQAILDNLIARGEAKPMIVVMPNCNETLVAGYDVMLAPGYPATSLGGQPVDLAGFPESTVDDRDITAFPKTLMTDLIPFIDGHYRTKKGKGARAIAGLSVGGAQTFYTALNYPEEFAYVGAFSGGYNSLPRVRTYIPLPADAAKFRVTNPRKTFDVEKFLALHPNIGPSLNGAFELLSIAIGEEDGLMTSHVRLTQLLDRKGVRYTAVTRPGYAHEWSFWRLMLREFLPQLFQG